MKNLDFIGLLLLVLSTMFVFTMTFYESFDTYMVEYTTYGYNVENGEYYVISDSLSMRVKAENEGEVKHNLEKLLNESVGIVDSVSIKSIQKLIYYD